MTNSDDSRLTVPLSEDAEWQEIAERLIEELVSSGEEIPEKAINVAEHLLAGYPLTLAAKKNKVSTTTVRRWITQYPTMGYVVSHGKKLLSKWRMAKLEQQFLTAINRSQEILELPLDGVDPISEAKFVDPKILTVVAAQSRYVIGLFAGQKIDIDITHNVGDETLKAHRDALDYLADKIQEQRGSSETEPIEAVFRVIDPKFDNDGPMLKEDGESYHGKLGVIDRNEQGFLCHICGARNKDASKHILVKHAMNVDEYEDLFLLERGSIYKDDSGE